METITAASNLKLSETTFKAHDNVELVAQPINVDENQENSVDNQQCQSQCVRLNKKICQKIASPNGQPCACDTDMATNGIHHSNQITNWNESIKSNGFHSRRDKEISTQTDEMDVCDYQLYETGNQILANLCDATRDGSLDTMISSDLGDTEIKLAEKKCTDDIVVNGSDANGHVIDKGHHRRTRARSESDQCEFFEARKQQMRRQAQHESNVSEL